MIYKITADVVVVAHFLWILFMIFGFLFTLYGVFFKREYLNLYIFRAVHLCGIFYVGLLVVLNRYCPLTLIEYSLRQKYNPGNNYTESFIIDWIQRLVYPDVNPLVFQIPTVVIAVTIVVLFIVFPPKIKKK